jgi:hypothetical protein
MARTMTGATLFEDAHATQMARALLNVKPSVQAPQRMPPDPGRHWSAAESHLVAVLLPISYAPFVQHDEFVVNEVAFEVVIEASAKPANRRAAVSPPATAAFVSVACRPVKALRSAPMQVAREHG